MQLLLQKNITYFQANILISISFWLPGVAFGARHEQIFSVWHLGARPPVRLAHAAATTGAHRAVGDCTGRCARGRTTL